MGVEKRKRKGRKAKQGKGCRAKRIIVNNFFE